MLEAIKNQLSLSKNNQGQIIEKTVHLLFSKTVATDFTTVITAMSGYKT
jgi:hypothetical protein